MKTIKVNGCADCPHCKYSNEQKFYYCGLLGQAISDAILNNADTLKDCPLEEE